MHIEADKKNLERKHIRNRGAKKGLGIFNCYRTKKIDFNCFPAAISCMPICNDMDDDTTYNHIHATTFIVIMMIIPFGLSLFHLISFLFSISLHLKKNFYTFSWSLWLKRFLLLTLISLVKRRDKAFFKSTICPSHSSSLFLFFLFSAVGSDEKMEKRNEKDG